MPAQWTGEVLCEMHVLGITARQLAGHLGCRPEYISAIFNGKRQPKNAEQKFRQAINDLAEAKKKPPGGGRKGDCEIGK